MDREPLTVFLLCEIIKGSPISALGGESQQVVKSAIPGLAEKSTSPSLPEKDHKFGKSQGETELETLQRVGSFLP